MIKRDLTMTDCVIVLSCMKTYFRHKIWKMDIYMIFPVYDHLYFHLKFTAGLERRGGVHRWPVKFTER